MTTIPKISIIIPVYNVEQYLRQCLDSVVNQTMQEIQIICVNDGSPDGSRDILQEYAALDSRIEIIDKPNGGQSSARNAGIAQIRGEYTYFVDSDDWLEPTLCEKAYYRLESTGADVVFFSHHDVVEKGQERRQISPLAYCQYPLTSSQASDFIDFYCVPWNRIIRSSFFQSLGTRFPEVFLPEDLYMHWVLLANDPHVEFIPEKLYYYRLRGGSIMGQGSEYIGKHCQAYSLVKDYLQRIGKYEHYRDLLLTGKIKNFVGYMATRKNVHPDALRWFRESLDDEEMDFLRNDPSLKSSVRNSVMYRLGDKSLRWKCLWHTFNQRVLRTVIIKPIEKIVKAFTTQKKVTHELELRIHELSEQVCQLSKEVVELRKQATHTVQVKRVA